VHDFGKSPEEFRGVVATPIVVGTSIYVQDATSSVYALDRATGTLLWEHRFRAPNFGRNGLSYGSGRLYGNTDTTAFALSAADGTLLWQRTLINDHEQFVDIAPLVSGTLVYTSTVGYPPDGHGAIYALDAGTGKVAWKFSTISDPWAAPAKAGGGGAWYTPSLDTQGNLYLGIANPYPLGGTPAYPNGAAFPGDALYTDSLVVLDAQTGKLRWHDQVTPHDVRDYDFQLPPILASIEAGGSQHSAVIGAGKAGLVVAWDRTTHTRLWQTPVGRHLNDSGPLPAHDVKICPGFFGGVETPLAYDDGMIFVPVVDLCSHGSSTGFQMVNTLDPLGGTGEFLALDASTGHVLWRRGLSKPDFGCATVSGGAVFTSTFDGELYGFDAATGRTLWQARAPAGINGCPAISGNLLLVPAGSGTTEIPRPPFQLVAYAP
jgi:alcohol dehydrogenase (cytochrome c)